MAYLAIRVLKVSKEVVESVSPVLLRQLELVDKATTLAASKDVAAYQGIQVMGREPSVGYDENYDPSDEAEARREAERHGWDPEELSGEERDALGALF
jgi:hypothetical protein|tara:strand:- start:16751 stop:17044 length:294 start_codon:yes stop_codon:yes gene_type:complete